MAAAFFHLLPPPLPPSPLLKTSFKTLHFPPLSYSFLTSSPARRISCCVKVPGSGSPSIGRNVADKNQTNLPPVIDLIQIYKDAIQGGDEKTVSELEGIFCGIEFEKNELLQQFTKLSMDINSEKNHYLRVQADFDNYRKRADKDRLTLTADIERELIESLLPLVDNFEKAKRYFKPESDKERRINASYQGIYKQFVETMRSLNVAVVQTVGKPFDPSVHEAVARTESKEFKEGIVVEETQRGFLLGKQLLRPAKVKVSAGPGPKAFGSAGKSTPFSAAESVLLNDT